jgi:hypothetical protein
MGAVRYRELILKDRQLATMARELQVTAPALPVETHRRARIARAKSRAFIESRLSMLKERLIWPSEFETLEEARTRIGAYVESNHRRPSRPSRVRKELGGWI